MGIGHYIKLRQALLAACYFHSRDPVGFFFMTRMSHCPPPPPPASPGGEDLPLSFTRTASFHVSFLPASLGFPLVMISF